MVGVERSGLRFVLVCIGFSMAYSDIVWNEANGHYYWLSNFTSQWAPAEAYAESFIYLGRKGYLASITSPEEWAFIRSKVNTLNVVAWVGGNDREVEGVWKWIGGPEKDLVIYTASSGTCYIYCNWNGGEPNNSGDEDAMQIEGWGSNGEWNDYSEYAYYPFVVEFGDSSLVNSTRPSTSGGTVIINGINFGSNEALIQVSIDGVACTNVTLLQANLQLSCVAPPGTGSSHTLIITVGNQVVGNDTSIFAYQSPTVTEVTNTSVTGGPVTIDGTNFGGNASLVLVTIGGTSCTNVELLVPHTKIRCQMPAGVGTELPVIVHVSDLTTSTATFTYQLDCTGIISSPASTCSTSIAQRSFPISATITQTDYFRWSSNCTSGTFTTTTGRATTLNIADPCTETCVVNLDICRGTDCGTSNVAKTCSSVVSVVTCSSVDISQAVANWTTITEPTDCEQSTVVASFAWSGFKYATSYLYCIGTASGTCDQTVGYIPTADTSASVNLSISSAGSYYLSVKGVNCKGVSQSVTATIQLPSITVPQTDDAYISALVPVVYCQQSSSSINLVWGNFASYKGGLLAANYDVCIGATGSDCSFLSGNNVTASNMLLTLPLNTTVRIRVRGINCKGSGLYKTINFTLVPNACCPGNCSGVGLCYNNQCSCPNNRSGIDCATKLYAPDIVDVPYLITEEAKLWTFTPTLLAGTVPITWSLYQAPIGMTINSTGTISWPFPVASPSAYTITVSAENMVDIDILSIPLYVNASYTAKVQVASATRIFGLNSNILLAGNASYVNTTRGIAVNQNLQLWVSNRGYTQIINVKTDSLGTFQHFYQVGYNVGGLFQVGVSHPRVFSSITQDSFEITGLILSSRLASATLLPGNNATFQLMAMNVGSSLLTNIGVTPQSVNNGSLQVIINSNATSLGGSEAVQFSFVVAAASNAGAQSSSLTFTVYSSNALATAIFTLDVTIQLPRPSLRSSPELLAAGMAKQSQTTVSFIITNYGSVPANNIQVQVPSSATFLTLVSTTTIATIMPGLATTVTLLLSPSLDMSLGTYEGAISFYDSTSYLLGVAFRFTLTSNLTGSLQVNCMDEYTYYADGAPKVENATITITDLSSNTMLVQTTVASGIFYISSIREGYYTIMTSAEGHGIYQATVNVVAGQTKTVTAFMPRQLIKFSWKVTPTTIEDTYTFTITTEFQTYVPAPVIVMDPQQIDMSEQISNEDGDYIFYINITNYGLIAGQHSSFIYPTLSDFSFESNLDGSETLIGGRSSVIAILKIKPTNKRATSGNACFTISLLYQIDCDGPRFYNVPLHFLDSLCTPSPSPPRQPPIDPWPGSEGIDVSPVTPVSPVGPPYVYPIYFEYEQQPCDPCLMELYKSLFKCLIQFVPGLGKAVGVIGKLTEAAGKNIDPDGNADPAGILKDMILDELKDKIGGNVLGNIPIGPRSSNSNTNPKNNNPSNQKGPTAADVKKGWGKINKCLGILESIPCMLNKLKYKPPPHNARQVDPLDAAVVFYDQMQYSMDVKRFWDTMFIYAELYSCDSVDNCTQLLLYHDAFKLAVADGSELGRKISNSEYQILTNPATFPANMNETQILDFLGYWNRTVNYAEAGILNSDAVPFGDSTHFIALDKFVQNLRTAEDALAASSQAGYDNVYDGAVEREADLEAALANPPAGTCAKVVMQIKQEAVVTRTAFEATLQITNDGSSPLENLFVQIIIKDSIGNDATDKFVIGIPTTTGSMIMYPSGNATVSAGSSGTASWLLVPLNDAVGATAEQFSVGGIMAYNLDSTSLLVPLYPVSIWVLPSPIFYVDYFQQKEVYGDDPFTSDIEPAEPFILGLMVRNVGYGDSIDFKITSGQPVIVDNEKGLVINFKIIGTRVGNQSTTPSLTIDFGGIPANQTAIAQFLLISSLQGTFISYNASFEYKSPLGDSRLCQVEHLAIHELSHVVQADTFDDLPDFLINEQADLSNLPDHLYKSDGTIISVTPFVIQQAELVSIATGNVSTITFVTTVLGGCVYFKVEDPFSLSTYLTGVQRSDGKVILTANYWRTHRIVRGINNTTNENFLHIFDCDSTGNYSFTFTGVLPTASVDILSTTATSALLQFKTPSTTIIKWKIEMRLAGSNTNFTLVETEYVNDVLLLSGLSYNSHYEIVVYPGRSDGYNPTGIIVNVSTSATCDVQCPVGKGTLNSTSCTCDCTLPWLGTGCLACGLDVSNCAAGQIPNYSTCMCSCPLCPTQSVTNTDCSCSCLSPWIVCGLTADSCPPGQVFNPETCSCMCLITCQNGGTPNATACNCKCPSTWQGTYCDISQTSTSSSSTMSSAAVSTTTNGISTTSSIISSTSGTIFVTSNSISTQQTISVSSSNVNTISLFVFFILVIFYLV